MTSLDLLRPHTTLNAQHRGWEYADRVDIVHGRAAGVRARVFGTSMYDVRLHADAGKLRVWCSCPYFADRGTACKHLWATAVRADENSWLADLPAETRVVIDIKDLEDHELSIPERGDSAATHRPRFVPPYEAPPRPPDWELALDGVKPKAREGFPAASANSQLLYVLSVPPRATVTEVPIGVEKRERRRDGEWGKPQPSRLTLTGIAYLPDADDRWALALIHSTSAIPREGGPYGYGLASQPLPVEYVKAPMLDMLLHRLCSTGRVILRVVAPGSYLPEPGARRPRTETDTALEWEPGEPWRLHVVVAREETAAGGAGYRVDAFLARGDRRASVQAFALLTDSIAVLDGVARPFDPAGGLAWARQLRSRGPISVPADSRRELIDSIASSGVEEIDLPSELQWDERAVPPRFRATIGTPTAWGACPVDVEVEYETTRAPVDGTTRVVSDDGRTIYRRDLREEQEALFTLKRHGVTGIDGIPVRKLPSLVHALVSEGWLVEAHGVRHRALQAPRLRIKSGIDWFDLDARDDEGAAIDLSEVLKAIKTGDRTIVLGDGTVGMLPEEWLARVAPVLALGDSNETGMRFRPSQVALVDALLAAQPAVDWDEGFARAREKMQRFAGVQPENPPATFRGTLRDYQREALGWMRFLRDFGFGGCLADDMGLGKTVMVLAMLQSRQAGRAHPHRPSLVVLPRSLLFNWVSEAERFTPELRVLDFAHADRHTAMDDIANADLVLTTYGTLRRDVPALQNQQFDYVILDEAQAIKNAATATAKAVRLLRADHRLALTGTPVENHLGELQSLFDFLNPGLLGRGGVLELRKASSLAESEAHVARLAKGLRPFFLRRTKEEVAPELPPRTEETLHCELEGEQLRTYAQLRDHYRRVLLKQIERDGLAKSRFQILEALLRLRQAACHIRLLPHVTTPNGSAKFDLLLPRLAELVDEGRKALVFSQFTSLLALLRKELDAQGVRYAYLDGETRDREAVVARFQDDASCPLFLISLRAGGVGLNLTAAEYVFLLDPWWNPAVEAQAIDRTHRIGQSKPVFAYRIVARDTVEERILELQSRKRALADAILDAGAGGLQGLQREDLEQLLS
jgi:superfamily II DNA or RNA helicase